MNESVKKKVLLLFLTGLALGLSYSPHQQWKVLKSASKEWGKIEADELEQTIRNLYRSKLVERRKNPDGTTTVLLNEKGKMRALNYHFEDMRIVSNEKWDGKWRLVIFDIPEKVRQGRDALRAKLRVLGFIELQKSAFVFPFECQKEIEFIVEFFGLRQYVRFGVLESIDNGSHLRKKFGLL